MPRLLAIAIFSLTALSSGVGEAAGNRFAYLDENDPYYPHGGFPKLITPMWVGEEGVDAVICLTVDDMCRVFPDGERPMGVPTYARRPRVYFDFLKPVIERLQQIDGRAPVSVFALQLDAEDKLVSHMRELGLSIECHTWTHPVPLLRTVREATTTAEDSDSLQAAIDDTLKSLVNLSQLPGPGRGPVAQRNPGCDARNTASPRMFAEIFPLRTAAGDFLRMDSSIFMAFTKPQSGMPREWFFHDDGRERFNKFVHGIPFTKTFRNYVADYPYPYIINRTIWELPAIIPGDAHGVHAYGKESNETVEDWKRAVDIVVAMKGVYTLCFHPHGYIEGEQVAALVDYADRTYGGRVKFLNCREIYDRLTDNLCGGVPLRDASGDVNPVSLADVNADGYLDVLLATPDPETRVWNRDAGQFDVAPLPLPVPVREFPATVRLFTAAADGRAGLAMAGEGTLQTWIFDDGAWGEFELGIAAGVVPPSAADHGNFRFRDFNGDDISDLVVDGPDDTAIYLSSIGNDNEGPLFRKATWSLPRPGMLFDAVGRDAGLRFVDLDADGDDDLVFSNEVEYGIWRFEDAESGWQLIRRGAASDPGAIPSIVEHGRNNGVWFHSGALIQANEFTAGEPDHIRHIPFEELLKPMP